ncbi:hypothetical protein C5Y93_01715 [Blastopirellula marina]|uniref:Uncharacterized protein n=1 Tax=Blastopirellula marina TaxID=124 RepID=A0A2S8GTN0_9BACT|nr:hypothetical protein C5Y93_01715 [Blastopirellula marina]
MLSIRSLLLLALALLVVPGPVSAQTRDTEQQQPGERKPEARQRKRVPTKQTGRQPGTTPQERKQREQDAIEFAREHHPALVRLLNHLRRIDQQEYNQAIRELARVSDRLSTLKQRNPRSYELQLEIWKANSSATLLAARIQLDPENQDLRDELYVALQRKSTLQRRLLHDEVERAKRRLKRLEEDLERFDRDKELLLKREFRKLAPPVTRSAEPGPDATDKQDPPPEEPSK